MAKEILLYSGINEYSSVEFINSVNELEPNDELKMRINTEGGNPQYGWGMIAKFNEFEGKKSIKVDGQAHSMGLMFLAYTNKENIEILDVAEGVLHRAAYPDWFEKSEYFTEELKGNLIRVNNSLMTAFKNRVNVEKLESLKGVKLKDVFSMDSRIDVFLTAKDMKDIGLVGKVIKITPKKAAELVAIGNDSKQVIQLAAKYTENKPNINKNNIMTIEDLKANHSEVYNQVHAVGSKAGVAEETDRVAAWLTFVDVDAEAVSKGIKEGSNLSMAATAELSRKQYSKEVLTAVANESAPVVVEASIVVDKNAPSAAIVELDALLNADKK